MKTLLIAIFAGFAFAHISAQDISSSEKSQGYQNTFYSSLIGKAAALNGSWGLFGGMRAGYNIDKNWSLGLVGNGLIPDKIERSYINRNGRDELHFGYGGAEAIYKYDLSDNFYLTGVMMIGAGRADYEIAGGYDYFFMMEPGASVNYKITDWFGVGYSLDYRLASGVKYADFSNASFSGWSMDLNFNFGF
ncbi:MAG TPA: hypothetical protein VKD08_05315 [Ignavibacteriaceae bacterium]|nr:hypothetical protein [Ignavibacteriaceae bacterium]